MPAVHRFLTNVHSEGAILPPELLSRIQAGDPSLEGLKPENYHLSPSERLSEAATRSYSRLLGLWSAFKEHLNALPEGDSGTRATRERWLLPLFYELGYSSLPALRGKELNGKSYALSHKPQEPLALMLISHKIDLDRRFSGTPGFSQRSPHSQMQEYLSRSETELWGIISNGFRLRILRNNLSLTRSAYVEFDLKAIMDSESYSEFFLLWLLCHQSRFEVALDESGRKLPPQSAWLEKWYQSSISEGVRALEELRISVKSAIEALGAGFLSHPSNSEIKEALRSGSLSLNAFYNQILRLVYRLILIFVAEDRDLLLSPDTPAATRELFQKYYATYRLRELAARRRGSRHSDLWYQLSLLFIALKDGSPALGISPLGSFLFSPEATADLNDCQIYNSDLLSAFRQLCYTQKHRLLQPINYRHLGPEELGSVYESLLEMQPEINISAGSFRLDFVAGSQRKTSGSYYTHSSLVNSLLDTALEPVIAAALARAHSQKNSPEAALLSLSICDPACGSGHFLIAAAHRLAKRLAALRSGEEEPAPAAIQHALREVIGSCIYGVDINPMAVELCKISLWMEALEAGKPLNFLDHHIQCGNSLIGCTPELLEAGIPDAAYTCLEGDDAATCRKYKKLNKDESSGDVIDLFAEDFRQYQETKDLHRDYQALSQISDDQLSGVQQKEASYQDFIQSPAYQNARLACDAWCAAFVWIKDGSPQRPAPLTFGSLESIKNDPDHLPTATKAEIQRLAEEYQFFHWHLAFPDIFGEEANTGFDCVLGNPPWERVKLQEKEFFAARDIDITSAPNATLRRLLILSLKDSNPELYRAFQTQKRHSETISLFLRESGKYPLCGRGDVNTYTVFAELNRNLISPQGRSGFIVPSGIATDDTTKLFFQELIDSNSLASLYDFENRAKLFPEVDSRFKFSLISLRAPSQTAPPTDFLFFAHSVLDLEDDFRHFQLSAAEIALINPNTRTCPIFRSKADAELCKYIYRRVPVLIDENGSEHGNPWGISFQRMFDMSNDSHLFKNLNDLEANGFVLEGNHFVKEAERYLPLYEAKMIHHFNYRYGDYADLPAGSASTQLPDVPVERLKTPNYEPLPRYWIEKDIVDEVADDNVPYLMGVRCITNTTNERTIVSSIIPHSAVGHSVYLWRSDQYSNQLYILLSNTSCFAFDFISRYKMGGTNLSLFIVHQLPVLPPSTFNSPDALHQRLGIPLQDLVLELVYTSYSMQPFALDCGYEGAPFIWDIERRFEIRCELDALFFHLYLGSMNDWERPLASGKPGHLQYFPTPRHAVEYIMESFPIVKKKDLRDHNEYRTKRRILEIYDQMQLCLNQNIPYQSTLQPPAGAPRRPDGSYLPMAEWDEAEWPENVHKGSAGVSKPL